MGEVVYLLKELGYYFANRKTIVKIADKLKKPGMTFLEETIINEQKPAL